MYFLRLTSDPARDVERNSSLHPTHASSIEEAREWHGDDHEYVVFDDDDELVGQVLDGLCGYSLDAETLEDARIEAITILNTSANSLEIGTRKAFVFQGEELAEKCPDGVIFWAAGEYFPVRVGNLSL